MDFARQARQTAISQERSQIGARQNQLMDFAIQARQMAILQERSRIGGSRTQTATVQVQAVIHAIQPGLLNSVTQDLRDGTKLQGFLAGNAPPLLGNHVTALTNGQQRLNVLLARANADLVQLNDPNIAVTLNAGALHQIRTRADAATSEVEGITANQQAANAYIQPLLVQHNAQMVNAATYPNLRLTHPILNDPCFHAALYTPGNLTALNNKMAGATVTGWQQIAGWPNTRAGVRPVGMALPVLIPLIQVAINNVPIDNGLGPNAQNLNLELGPEIIVDWMFPNPGHGKPYRELYDKIRSVTDPTDRIFQMFRPTVRLQGNGNYLASAGNYNFNLIINGARNMVITYYGLT